MLDRPLPPPHPTPAGHSDASIRRRAQHGFHAEVFTQIIEVELSGHKGCGSSIKLEVDFTHDFVGELITEIVAVRPFEYRMLATGFMGTERHLLPCPNWLAELLIGCVDADCLKADS